MEIIDIKHIEDCFDGSFTKEVRFNKEVSQDTIKQMGNSGKLNYFASFRRPYYKIMYRDDFYIKGVEGNTTARLNIKTSADIKFLQSLIK